MSYRSVTGMKWWVNLIWQESSQIATQGTSQNFRKFCYTVNVFGLIKGIACSSRGRSGNMDATIWHSNLPCKDNTIWQKMECMIEF